MSRLKIKVSYPARAIWRAANMPAGPAPTTKTPFILSLAPLTLVCDSGRRCSQRAQRSPFDFHLVQLSQPGNLCAVSSVTKVRNAGIYPCFSGFPGIFGNPARNGAADRRRHASFPGIPENPLSATAWDAISSRVTDVTKQTRVCLLELD